MNVSAALLLSFAKCRSGESFRKQTLMQIDGMNACAVTTEKYFRNIGIGVLCVLPGRHA